MLINCQNYFRNKSNGEGIFTFYSECAQNILKDIKYAKSPKKKNLSGETGAGSKETAGGSLLRNPLTYLFKRESSGAGRTENKRQEKGRRKVLEKSVSMMEEFNRQEKISCQQKKDLIKELKSSNILSAKSSSLTRTRTQPNMSPRHLETSYYSCDEFRDDTPSPPPYPDHPSPAPPAQTSDVSPPDTNMKEILSSGHYYSFDKVLLYY